MIGHFETWFSIDSITRARASAQRDSIDLFSRALTLAEEKTSYHFVVTPLNAFRLNKKVSQARYLISAQQSHARQMRLI